MKECALGCARVIQAVQCGLMMDGSITPASLEAPAHQGCSASSVGKHHQKQQQCPLLSSGGCIKSASLTLPVPTPLTSLTFRLLPFSPSDYCLSHPCLSPPQDTYSPLPNSPSGNCLSYPCPLTFKTTSHQGCGVDGVDKHRL